MKDYKTPADRVFDIFNYVFLGLVTFVCAFPFYYIIINSVSNNQLASTGKIMFWPVGIHFQNFVSCFSLPNMAHSAFISVARTVLGTVVTVLLTSFLGYAFTKNEYPNRTFWYRFVIITMYINAGLIPWFLNMKALHLTNNFLAYIIGAAIAPFSLILFKTYVESIPPSLEESAEMDGAGYLTLFFRIIFPLSMPIVATVAIFSAVGQWNSFFDTLILMNSPRLFTLQFMLYGYLNQAASIASIIKNSTNANAAASLATRLSPTSVRMTITVIVTMPVLLVYPIFQKYFVSGIMIGAVKG